MKSICIFIVMLMSLVSTAHAVKMESIYGAEVPVASQNEQLRAKAMQQAFADTLIKASGSSTVLQNPVIKAALPQAKNNAEEFGYVPSNVLSAPFLLKVKFDAEAVKELLRQAKAPLWGENRPLILVWLVIEKADHTVDLVDNSSTNDFVVLLKKRADQRGLPLLLPVMDMTDLNQLSVADVRAMLVPALQKVSLRYHADGLLVGNIQQNDQGVIQSHWKLIVGKDQGEWRFTNSVAKPGIEELIDKIAVMLGGQQTAVLSDQSIATFTLVVKGVAQQEDLHDLMRLMKHIPLIKSLEMGNIMGDKVMMYLTIQGGRQAFMQDAAVEQHLHLELEEGNELTYLWMR